MIHVLEHYPEGEIVMILDNAKIHHANLLKDLLDGDRGKVCVIDRLRQYEKLR